MRSSVAAGLYARRPRPGGPDEQGDRRHLDVARRLRRRTGSRTSSSRSARGGEGLHEWAFASPELARDPRPGGRRAQRRLRRRSRRRVAATGAVVMGRRMFSGGSGPWEPDPRARGWWGEDPPFHAPVFVLTHHAREPLPMEGGTTFHFVTDGIESAVEQARAAAGEKDVLVAGGGTVVAAGDRGRAGRRAAGPRRARVPRRRRAPVRRDAGGRRARDRAGGRLPGRHPPALPRDALGRAVLGGRSGRGSARPCASRRRTAAGGTSRSGRARRCRGRPRSPRRPGRRRRNGPRTSSGPSR